MRLAGAMMLAMDHTATIEMLALLGNNPSHNYPHSCCHCVAATHLDRAPSDVASVWPVQIMHIVCASQNFEGPAWGTYEMAFRRQAANWQSLDWGITDPILYNEAFTGTAKQAVTARMPKQHAPSPRIALLHLL